MGGVKSEPEINAIIFPIRLLLFFAISLLFIRFLLFNLCVSFPAYQKKQKKNNLQPRLPLEMWSQGGAHLSRLATAHFYNTFKPNSVKKRKRETASLKTRKKSGLNHFRPDPPFYIRNQFIFQIYSCLPNSFLKFHFQHFFLLSSICANKRSRIKCSFLLLE